MIVALGHGGCDHLQRFCLHALAGRESGSVYLASRPLSDSLAAMLLQSAGPAVVAQQTSGFSTRPGNQSSRRCLQSGDTIIDGASDIG